MHVDMDSNSHRQHIEAHAVDPVACRTLHRCNTRYVIPYSL